MKKVFVILGVCVFLISCELIDTYDTDNFNDLGTTIIFKLFNNTLSEIPNISICLKENQDIIVRSNNILPNENSAIILDMKQSVKVDGTYLINYEFSGVQYEHSFGYYTNDCPLEESMNNSISGSSIDIGF